MRLDDRYLLCLGEHSLVAEIQGVAVDSDGAVRWIHD